MTLNEIKEQIEGLIEIGYGTFECVGRDEYGDTAFIVELGVGTWTPLETMTPTDIVSFETEGWTGG